MAPSTKKELTNKTLVTKAKSSTATKNKKKGAATIRDPDAKPKRPLSAYNLFFQYERDMLLRSKPSKEGQSHESMHMTIHNDPSERRNRSKTVRPPPHGKIGFAELAKIIGSKWKSLDDPARKHFQDLAAVEKKRYVKECKEWKERMDRKKQLEGETAVTTTSTDSMAKATATKPKKAQKQTNKTATTCTDVEIAAERMLGEHSIKLPSEDDVLPPIPEVPTQSFNGPGEAHHSSVVQQSEIYDMLNRACEIAEEGIYASSAQPTSHMEQQSGCCISYAIGTPASVAYGTNRYGSNNHHHQVHQITAFAPPTNTVNSASLPHPQHTNVAPNTHPREGYNSHGGGGASKVNHCNHQLPTTQYQHSWNVASNCSSKVPPSMKTPRVVSNGSIGGVGFSLTGTGGVVDNTNFDGDILDFLSRIVSD